MEKRINVAELLKDCPKGMELDCTMYDNLYFDGVVENYRYPIGCYTIYDGCRTSVNFTEFGEFNNHGAAKCVIFPKGKTTWDNFVPPCPFKDGDVVATNNGAWIGIITGGESGRVTRTYCAIKSNGAFEAYLYIKDKWVFDRLATEEEKQKLFDAIKANGYKWNAETKTLEKLVEPKFKVGDRIKSKYNNFQYDVTALTDTHYTLVEVEDKFQYVEPIIKDKNWELVPNKFDIATLKPFNKVLVRCSTLEKWHTQLFEKYDKTYQHPFICMGCNKYKQCIPYEGNEHLLDKADDCDDFYKTW